MKRLKHIILSLGTALSLVIGSAPVAFAEDLIGNIPSELIGTASAFSVFAKEASFNGSDCEGRIAAQIGINKGAARYYSTANTKDNLPSVIIGNEEDGYLEGLDNGNRLFIVGEKVKLDNIKQNNVYIAEPIDFEKEFAHLESVSLQLKSLEVNGTVEKTHSGQRFVGENKDYNIFTVEEDYFTTFNQLFEFDVPEDSYVVVNVLGENPTFYSQLYGATFAGKRISNNSDETISHILFNFPEAKTLTLVGIGTFYNATLAPFADVEDSITSGVHMSGNIICRNLNSGTEYGKVLFSGPEIDNVGVVTTTSTTTTSTTTTTTTTTTVPVTTTLSTTTVPSTTTTQINTTTLNTTSATTTSNTTTTKLTAVINESGTTITTTDVATTTTTTVTIPKIKNTVNTGEKNYRIKIIFYDFIRKLLIFK